mgnify:CR=1 FL=1
MAVQPQLLPLQKTMLMAEGMGTRLNPHVNIWELARPLIEERMQSHFGPRVTIGRAVEDLAQGLRRLPRLIDSLHVVAERGRRQAEADPRSRRPPPARTWLRIGFAETIAVLALIAAIVAWWHWINPTSVIPTGAKRSGGTPPQAQPRCRNSPLRQPSAWDDGLVNFPLRSRQSDSIGL